MEPVVLIPILSNTYLIYVFILKVNPPRTTAKKLNGYFLKCTVRVKLVTVHMAIQFCYTKNKLKSCALTFNSMN